MIASSDNDYFVISDSDILVGPDFLRNVIPPLLDPKVGLVTCLYQGIPAPDFWSQMEAIGMSVEMPAGVMVADMVEGMKFALGAAMTVRRDAIEAIGGMRETADFYSDDFVLGNLVDAPGFRGCAVALQSGTRTVGMLAAPHLRRSAALDEEHALFTPVGPCRLGPHLCGALRTAGAAAGIRTSGASLCIGRWLFAMAWINRMLLALVVGWGIIRDPRCLWLCWLYPLRDLLGFCTWLGSFTGNKFLWRGEPYQFGEAGRITPVARSIEFERDRVPQAHD